MAKGDKPEAQIYQLKVTLKGSKPPIWRRVLVPADTSLSKLHRIIQVTMGWYDAHLHQFIVGRTFYSLPDDYGFDDFDSKSTRGVKLSTIAPREKSKFIYEYDFGDGWEHEVLVEKILPREPGVRYPLCVKGKRACPPEDCGGIWGYAALLETISDPSHPEHEEMLEWLGGGFDPEAFGLEAINERLRSVR
jgi:hypothetical protein